MTEAPDVPGTARSARWSRTCLLAAVGRLDAATELRDGTDVKTRVLSGLGDGLACAEVCHDALVDLSRKEAFQASDDLACGPAIGGASGDVVAGWLVESHADDDGSIEGGVGVWRWRVGGEFVGIRHRSIFGSREPGVPRDVVAMA